MKDIDEKLASGQEIKIDTPILETVQKMVLTCGIGDL